MKKPNWQSHKRGAVPMHVYESAVTGFAKYYKKYFNLEFSELLNYFDDELVYWCWDLNMMQEFALKYSKIIQNETQNEFMNKWIKLASQLMKISLEINNLDLNNLSNYEKYKLYQKIHLSSEKFHTYSATSIDFMDEFLPSIVENEYKKLPIKFQNSVNHKILTSLFDLSVVAQKEIDLLKLKINKISIDEFYSKYFWINCGFSDWPIYSKKEINNNLSEIKLSPNKIEQKINSIYHDVDANKLIKKKLLDKIANQKFTNLINFADTMVFYHDDRKKHQMISIMAMNRILKSIKEYNFNDLLWCKGSEIAEYLRTGKKLDIEKIRSRKKGSLIHAKGRKIQYSFGTDIKSKVEKIIFNKTSESDSEIKGSVASPGFVKGTVKVILDPRGMLDKVGKNDILVTGMTTPDFVPIMKKVGAIVTDNGGLTCHAAIISRELGIPCVIGTKIATQILKDGDLIEVDANKGIIKVFDKEIICQKV